MLHFQFRRPCHGEFMQPTHFLGYSVTLTGRPPTLRVSTGKDALWWAFDGSIVTNDAGCCNKTPFEHGVCAAHFITTNLQIERSFSSQAAVSSAYYLEEDCISDVHVIHRNMPLWNLRSFRRIHTSLGYQFSFATCSDMQHNFACLKS